MKTITEIKIASIIVHVQELLSSDGREIDRQALIPLVNDPDVVAWLKKFDKALLPVKRLKEMRSL